MTSISRHTASVRYSTRESRSLLAVLNVHKASLLIQWSSDFLVRGWRLHSANPHFRESFSMLFTVGPPARCPRSASPLPEAHLGTAAAAVCSPPIGLMGDLWVTKVLP